MKVRMMLAVLGALSVASHASAKSLATAPALRTFPAAQTLYCDITNLDTVPRNVTIEGMDSTGAVVDGPYITTMAPSTGDYMVTTNPNASWCRFSVTNGSLKALRGMAVYDNGLSYVISLPAE